MRASSDQAVSIAVIGARAIAEGGGSANANPGTNVNVLASSGPEDLEPLAGMAFLNGIPAPLERAAPAAARAVPEDAAHAARG